MYSKYELDHAIRYATHLTKVFLFEKFKKSHSYLFDRAYIETRPATGEDYYIPHSIASKCIVVTNIYFDEIGCHKVACFPVKEDLSPCEKNDKPEWIPIGKGFTLSCQPACQYEGAIDTELNNFYN
ncbi:baculo_p74_N domain-containing protein [Trichonephila inaurata madagascariensis]|uniref:Baculo_p74_N domain-containing protein n=1 Tax=Trichonephila inaurata madagascariensis TaxID=2747483 RepID=A0A8X6Y9P0_9ARAC|nr:baculo_p74_N domain-containing protein [Trichonephila inaurata madagascariensis]